jgi:hypothetical protein
MRGTALVPKNVTPKAYRNLTTATPTAIVITSAPKNVTPKGE